MSDTPPLWSRPQSGTDAAPPPAVEPIAHGAPSPSHPPVLQPTLRFLLSHPAHFVALGFGAGLAPRAPGTFGALLGWWLGTVALKHATTPTYFMLVLAAFAVGVWACHVTGPRLGKTDHGAIVWDEVVAMMLVIWFVPSSFAMQVLGFLLFRFFDIVKPPPISYFDRKWKHGLGVMFDDFVAACMALIALALWARLT
jgi:phosphatidylglycerophosphatase A